MWGSCLYILSSWVTALLQVSGLLTQLEQGDRKQTLSFFLLPLMETWKAELVILIGA